MLATLVVTLEYLIDVELRCNGYVDYALQVLILIFNKLTNFPVIAVIVMVIGDAATVAK